MAKPILDPLTCERAREILDYSPETGIATVKLSRSNRVPVGTVLKASKRCEYVRFTIDGRPYKLHRLIWLYTYGVWPAGDIDHINGDPSDNRLVNLRDVPHQTNAQNHRKAWGHNRSTGLLGASLHKFSGLYIARIRVSGVVHSLGYYKTPEEAHQAYLAGKRKLHAGCTI
jgi:hypothetical protein